MARRVLAVVACVSSARALVAPADAIFLDAKFEAELVGDHQTIGGRMALAVGLGTDQQRDRAVVVEFDRGFLAARKGAGLDVAAHADAALCFIASCYFFYAMLGSIDAMLSSPQAAASNTRAAAPRTQVHAAPPQITAL